MTLITGERDEKFRALAEEMREAATERAARDHPEHRARRRSSRTRKAVAQAIYQSGSPSSSASA